MNYWRGQEVGAVLVDPGLRMHYKLRRCYYLFTWVTFFSTIFRSFCLNKFTLILYTVKCYVKLPNSTSSRIFTMGHDNYSFLNGHDVEIAKRITYCKNGRLLTKQHLVNRKKVILHGRVMTAIPIMNKTSIADNKNWIYCQGKWRRVASNLDFDAVRQRKILFHSVVSISIHAASTLILSAGRQIY